MLTCPNPTCQKPLTQMEPVCPHCRTDLALLVDYVGNLKSGLERAEELTRQGELGEAFWAYLEVLEVDPDNPEARRQVGQVVTAVRQFDRADPGRRWLKRLQKQARLRQRLQLWEKGDSSLRWLMAAALLVLLVAATIIGYMWGYHEGQVQEAGASPTQSAAP